MGFDTDDTFLYAYSHKDLTTIERGPFSLARCEDGKDRPEALRAESPTCGMRGETWCQVTMS